MNPISLPSDIEYVLSRGDIHAARNFYLTCNKLFKK